MENIPGMGGRIPRGLAERLKTILPTASSHFLRYCHENDTVYVYIRLKNETTIHRTSFKSN